MATLSPILLLLPFIIMGMRFLRNSFQGFFGAKIHHGLLGKTVGSYKNMAIGTVGSFLVLSNSIYTRLILNLLQGRLVLYNKALYLSLGSLLSSFFIVLPFLITNTILSLVLMVVGSLGLLWSRRAIPKLFSSAFFGLGLAYCGLSFGQHYFESITGQIEPWSAFGIGVFLSIALRSNSIALIVGLWSLGEGTNVAPFLYCCGVLFGGAVWELRLTYKACVSSKKLIFILLVQRLLACLLGVSLTYWLWDKEGNINRFDALFFYGFIIVSATCITLFFKKVISKISDKVFTFEEYPERPKLQIGLVNEDIAPSIALIQARRQAEKMADITERIFVNIKKYISSESSPRLLAKIKDYKRVTDNMKVELENFLLVIMEQSLTRPESQEINRLQKLVRHLESIIDQLDKIAIYKTQADVDEKLPEDIRIELLNFYIELELFFQKAFRAQLHNFDELSTESEILKEKITDLHGQHAFRMESSELKISVSINYLGILAALKVLIGECRHISNALSDMEN